MRDADRHALLAALSRAARVHRHLGDYHVVERGAVLRISWTGGQSRNEQGRCLHEARVELEAAGFRAVEMPGIGLVVRGQSEVGQKRDGECAVHNLATMPLAAE